MKVLLSFILVVFTCLSVGCYQYTTTDNYIVFPTPFGPITKGDSMREVVEKLGDPIDLSHYERKEIWRYNLTKIGEVFVYFENGDVIDVQSSGEFKDCDECKGGGQ